MTKIPKAGQMTIEKFRKLRDEGYADFESGLVGTNKRKAKCRICRITLNPGEAVGYIELITDGYRMNDKYVCHSCEEKSRPERG